MKKLPSIRQLDELGSDAGPFMDAWRRDLEQGIAMAASKKDRAGLVRALRWLDRRHIEYFGEDA